MFNQKIDEILIVKEDNIFRHLGQRVIISEDLIEKVIVHKPLLSGLLKLEHLTKKTPFL